MAPKLTILASATIICLFMMACGNQTASNNNNANLAKTSTTSEKKLTAREAFQLAQAEAKKWKSDAKLYAMSQRGVLQTINQGDASTTFDFADVKTGSSRRWIVEFFSDKTLEVLFVNVMDGKAESDPVSKFDKKPPSINGNWIDSSDALKSARAEIEKSLHITQDKYMALSRLESGKEFPVWTVEFYQSQGDKALYGVVVNAISGKVEQSEKAD